MLGDGANAKIRTGILHELTGGVELVGRSLLDI